MKNIKFQYYSNKVISTAPEGFITLPKFLNAIKNPKKATKELLKKIEIASKEGNMTLKSELKKGLYAFTPAVIVNGARKYDNVVKYTGLAVLDFDKISHPIEFKEFLFNEYKQIISAWLSPSKKGIKALVKIPEVKTKSEFKSYSWGLSAEMEIYKGFDIAVNNAVLLMFIGYDPNILIRENFVTWTQKGTQINSFELAKKKEFKQKDNITDNHTKWVISWFTKSVDAINDNAHPQIRSYAVALGGYVGSGYISLQDANNLAESIISRNPYMKKGTSGYIKTAKQSIQVGISKPLTFDK